MRPDRPADVDRLSALLERFRVRARLFHTGPMCGLTRLTAEPGRGFLHVLRRGEMSVTHAPRSGLPPRVHLSEPTLLFYPRPVTHVFHNPPVEGSDFTCASLAFDGEAHNPVARALPPLIVLPLAHVDGLDAALSLLFAETARVRCGQRLLADRLFEVVLIQLLRWLIDHAGDIGVRAGLLVGLSDPRIARSLVALHEAPGDTWSLASMAARAGMSRSAFAQRFRALVGQTPGDYLADWRLTLAQSALREGRAVKAIAHELGYANASALSRVFRQRVGRSPRDWLRDDAASAITPRRAGAAAV